jgi:biopolymer transport protein ExbD
MVAGILGFAMQALVLAELPVSRYEALALTHWVMLLCVICSGVGAGLWMVDRRNRSLQESPPVASGVRDSSYARLPARRPSKNRLFTGLPSYGLVACHAWLLILVPYWVFLSLQHSSPRGLLVHLMKPGPMPVSNSGIPALLIRVERDGNLYVNAEKVPWENLGTVLRRELARRPPTWPVYVEGDPSLEWKQVARAIDTVAGLQAQSILLTR